MTSPPSDPCKSKAPDAHGHDDMRATDARLLLALADDSCGAGYDPAALDEADRLRRQQHPVLDSRPDWRTSRVLKQRCRPWLERGCPWSLSHSHGHAVLALWQPPVPDHDPASLSQQGIGALPPIAALSQVGNRTREPATAGTMAGHEQLRIGVDLERVKPRNFAALLPQFARPEEIAWWRAQPDPAVAFYRLWTLKEALLKAGGLDFPADLQRVGLHPPASPERAVAGQGTGQPATQSGPVGAWPLRGPAEHGWHGLSAVLDGQWLLACVWPARPPDPVTHWQRYGHGWPATILADHHHP